MVFIYTLLFWNIVAVGTIPLCCSDFIKKVNTPVYLSISFLSQAISFLDSQVKKGQPSYGYPGIKNDYFYGKHYRFWLPAYVSYKMRTSEGLNKKASFEGSYLLALLYEMFAKAGARRGRAQFSEDHYSDFSNGVRLDSLSKKYKLS